jgi:hypothetical protein
MSSSSLVFLNAVYFMNFYFTSQNTENYTHNFWSWVYPHFTDEETWMGTGMTYSGIVLTSIIEYTKNEQLKTWSYL